VNVGNPHCPQLMGVAKNKGESWIHMEITTKS